MRTRPSIIAALTGLAAAAAVAGCGSSTSKAPGVQTVPSSGVTSQAASAVTTTSSTTTAASTTTSSVPLPAALKTKPKIVLPKGPPPKTLVIKDLIKGTGAAVTAGATVTVQYVGVLYKNGKQFDASWNDGSGQPVSLPLTGVIPGWQKGLIGMKIGGRRELIIPPSLGYRSQAQAKIPANSTLIFVIDLHAIS